MQDNGEMTRLEQSGEQARVKSFGLLGKVLMLATSAVLLVVGLVFSVLVFALAATAAILILGFVWWKTRHRHRQMRERPPGGRIIDGEVIRETRKSQ